MPANRAERNQLVPLMSQSALEALAPQGDPISGVNPRENFNAKIRGVLLNPTEGLWPRNVRKPKGADWTFY